MRAGGLCGLGFGKWGVGASTPLSSFGRSTCYLGNPRLPPFLPPTLLPRHREFKAGLRREFSKLTHCLQAYALVARGVRLIATHQQGSGPRATVVATQGSTDAWSDVIAVFGPKAAAGLQTFSADLSEDVCGGSADAEEGREGGTEQTDPSFRVTGYVSRPGMGGRMQGAVDRGMVVLYADGPCLRQPGTSRADEDVRARLGQGGPAEAWQEDSRSRP